MTIAAGIDVGTGAVKAAIFKVEDGKETWLSRDLMRIRQRDPMELARLAFDHILKNIFKLHVVFLSSEFWSCLQFPGKSGPREHRRFAWVYFTKQMTFCQVQIRVITTLKIPIYWPS